MRKKIGIICLLMVICIISIAPKSYGAIASKPTTKTDGSNVLVNKTISEAFVLCKNMTSNGESLYGATVKPHLATNKDWGAVSYLSNSSYGTNTAGKNTGVAVIMNGVKYCSTTGNTSGVMNWANNPNTYRKHSYTSGILKSYMDSDEKKNNSVIELVNAASVGSDYVEIIDTTEDGFNDTTEGMALSEITGFSTVNWKYVSNKLNGPISVRNGLFGFDIGTGRYDWYDVPTAGSVDVNVTFRPVIWN